MEQANRDRLVNGLSQFGVSAGADSLVAIERHLAMVREWNERVNLTAITDERDMVLKHAVDSVTALSVVAVNPGTRVLDVGTGAGFPGVVLKCVQPAVHVVLLESLQKRCKFLEAAGEELIAPLGGPAGSYEVLWGRAEDLGQQQALRESFDLVTARAVAELRVLSEYCLPFVRLGGYFLAMKGPGAQEEIGGATKAIETLGGKLQEAREIELPEDAGRRTLIVVKKVRATPKGYPRKAGTPAKSPL